MKRSIEWHENVIKNRRATLGRMLDEIDRLKDSSEVLRTETAFYNAQVELAKEDGKDGFDAERFGHSRLLR